ncbi:mannose-1-phosphate guanylyltransferase/mannose-6-phosphate isomerase [Chromobacterium sphagni]|uniref:mannose-1-phosphate guanylyltransferase n=2 Tax=Chromobacterium sphagni TaxID=1903179 RepID=A0A1S1WVL5_9NEIS|nr:mannose-1-phosphate guanylyltransferase/mannose-6-phosphate isomerase [Chromobacterium sphagni]OHX11289.1 mannose-1-phosphate guanylyltransferase/mannose-6-phosphate isomerase [Chromobacterium sphagni]OHX19033.1 mannose-1-phosphate guanylyltransferase/mannose-6-phosphate isomerase [Chromobacterium sphagni]
MQTTELIPCIISGGAGTRLWPVSRQELPKPFIRMADKQSLLQKTFLRAARLPGVRRMMVITSQQVMFHTLAEYGEVNERGLDLEMLLEPVGRNTAPAIAAAVLDVLSRGDGRRVMLLVLPADHLLEDEVAFAEAVARAQALAEQGRLVTFGLKPSRPETGFGYIEQGEAVSQLGCRVARFIEKPDAATAASYLADGRFLWNSGMFCFAAETMRAELARHAPDVLASVAACLEVSPDLVGAGRRQRELDRDSFSRCADISIDYAVMERSSEVAVVPCELGWSDIGSWDSLAKEYPQDENGNASCGETLLHDTHNSFVQSCGRLVATLGVDNLLVIDTPDALLVADRTRSQEVRNIAAELKRRGHPAYLLHRTSQRPWGQYTVLEDSPHYKIKRIVVRAGASLSLQLHHHRSEHWIVVSGTALVINGEDEKLVHTNQSTFIPAGKRHRLANPGVIELVMIEVQSGDYLGEDDIVRFDDHYGRGPAG